MVFNHNAVNKSSIQVVATLSAKINGHSHQIICSSISLGTRQPRVGNSFNSQASKQGMHNLFKSTGDDNNPLLLKWWTTQVPIDPGSSCLDAQLIFYNQTDLIPEQQTWTEQTKIWWAVHNLLSKSFWTRQDFSVLRCLEKSTLRLSEAIWRLWLKIKGIGRRTASSKSMILTREEFLKLGSSWACLSFHRSKFEHFSNRQILISIRNVPWKPCVKNLEPLKFK